MKPKTANGHMSGIHPPHNGGKFKLPKSMMELFPCLGEFSYQKMLAVTIMQGVNNYRLTLGRQPLAVRETDNEMRKSSPHAMSSKRTKMQPCLILYMLIPKD